MVYKLRQNNNNNNNNNNTIITLSVIGVGVRLAVCLKGAKIEKSPF